MNQKWEGLGKIRRGMMWGEPEEKSQKFNSLEEETGTEQRKEIWREVYMTTPFVSRRCSHRYPDPVSNGHAKSRPSRKDPKAGKDRGRKEKMAVEDETVRQRHRLDGHESEQTPRETAEDRGAWHAAAHGSQRVRCDSETEQQQLGKRKF